MYSIDLPLMNIHKCPHKSYRRIYYTYIMQCKITHKDYNYGKKLVFTRLFQTH